MNGRMRNPKSREPAFYAYALLALVFTYPVANILVLPKILLEGVRLWIHEFGHSSIAWLGGIAATPLPFGWSNLGEDRSTWVHVCLLFLLGVMAYRSFTSKNYYWTFIAGILLALKAYFSLGLSIDRLRIAIVYGGVGGEFFFSAFLCCASFHRFTDEKNWDWIKWVLLIAAAYALWASSLQWIEISRGKADLPFGTLIHGQDDSGGDMNQLLDDAGWTRKEIVAAYLKTMRWSWACVAIHYLISLGFELMKAPHPGDAQPRSRRR